MQIIFHPSLIANRQSYCTHYKAPPILLAKGKSVTGTRAELKGEQVAIIHPIRALYPIPILLEPCFKIHWLSE